MSSTSLSFTATSTPSANACPGPPPAALKGLMFFIRMMSLGLTLSSIAYGVVVALSITTASVLHNTTINKKKRIHYILFSFIAFVFLLSTINISSALQLLIGVVDKQSIPSTVALGKSPSAVVIVLVTWGADGFLLWRAVVLYENVQKVWRHLLYFLIGILSFAQVGAGVLYLLSNFKESWMAPHHSRPIFYAFSITTLSINWIITGLVVSRLLYFRARISGALGSNYGTPFSKIINMCVESSLIIIVVATLFVVETFVSKKPTPFWFSRIFLTNIYAIAPLLIIYRVAQGKTFSTAGSSFTRISGNTSTSYSSGRSGSASSALRFADPTAFNLNGGKRAYTPGSSTLSRVSTSEIHGGLGMNDEDFGQGKFIHEEDLKPRYAYAF